MQPEPGRSIHSVSDLLYSPDEIEFLLDEDIRDLEPVSVKPEDIQDFEIAGSATGGGASLADCVGGAGCPACDSPVGTAHSWDSHAHYRRCSASSDISLYSGVIVYCDHAHFLTPTGVFRVLFLATAIACLACLCTSGTAQVGIFMLPLAGRLRFMMFVALLATLITFLLLFLDVSHVVYLFPFNWGKVNAYLYVSLSVLFLVASSLIFHTIFVSESFSWVPKWTHHQLLVTGCLGYICAVESAIISLIQKCKLRNYQPVGEDPSLNLQERQLTPERSPNHKVNQTTYNYKPLAQHPSTSREQPGNYIHDDVQPCSSKTSELPFRLA